MHLSEFDYELSKNLIAQIPSKERDKSNLMILNREDKTIEHKKFFNITEYLTQGDVLVMNNTRVIPARLLGKKTTGANIEVFLLEKTSEKVWFALIKPSKRVKQGTEIRFANNFSAEVLSREKNDKWKVELIYKDNENFEKLLDTVGNVPLPPYIERKISEEKDETIKKLDVERYQTVYAEIPGSVAAPTAGLHFTESVFKKLKEKNIKICSVSLNVGLGTFKPVKAENILDHEMDKEYYNVPEATAEIIKNAKKHNKKIVAVGTTTVRTLETAFDSDGNLLSSSGWSDLFICV